MLAEKRTVSDIFLFPKYPKYSEKSLRLGFQISIPQNSFNLAIPFLLTILFYSKKVSEKPELKKQTKHVLELISGSKVRVGVDRYLGEFAILLPLFKLWLIAEPLSLARNSIHQFSFTQFLFKVSFFEIILRIKIMGCGFYIHIPFYEITFLQRLRDERNRKFFAHKHAQL